MRGAVAGAGTVIVGGGTAGCVLAARLSADPEHTVCLLEAGPVWGSAAELPADLRLAGRMPIGPESPWVWRYPVRLADGPVRGNIVRGRVIGGSGAINGGYFVRALATDFAAWGRECPEWAFEAVLPGYQQIERDLDYGEFPGHGSSGPIPVRRAVDPVPVSVEFATAALAAGFPEIPDLNALPEAIPETGVGPVPCNVDSGMRAGSATEYLLPALTRPNLTVHGSTMVTRIRFRGTRAVGVDYVRDGQSGTIAADRIVLCAGAVESAALLLRSGVGPPEQLRTLGIPVVGPAPVGAWCTDHPEIGIDYRGAATPVADTVALEYSLFLDDVEIRPYAVRFGPDPKVRRLGVALMRPHSAGELRLVSADPRVPPSIEYRYLAAEYDRERFRAAVGVATELLRAIPGAAVPDQQPDNSWLRANLGTSQHLSGTCRMGPAFDESAVVDQRFRVHGLTGLAVADLSVVPVPLSRGPQATVLMIAEQAGRLLERV
ncbi:mycofactocin system GMC family oxidoreductase MftG [Nocardia sp. XZ_19_385]|uniref:mycofactocin dehydrogenase MftG n=1 Tax=Nocardia sp. XZ_19_385 TaxID=2769488 RepID=UPI00189022E3|nr:mycofactocin system GMC family oxidoreductase MftG [Nocardia sp. XZ_19_385]